MSTVLAAIMGVAADAADTVATETTGGGVIDTIVDTISDNPWYVTAGLIGVGIAAGVGLGYMAGRKSTPAITVAPGQLTPVPQAPTTVINTGNVPTHA